MGEMLGRSKIVKTRKKHKCASCNRTIPKGRYAESWVNVDGGIERLYLCYPCYCYFLDSLDGYVEDCQDIYEAVVGDGREAEIYGENDEKF